MKQPNIVEAQRKHSEIRMKSKKKNGKKKIPTCINRHIIKYYVVTEHTLVHGFDMEADSWRVRSVSSGPKAVCVNILTSKNNASPRTCSHL